jgi:hypothetical protein
MSEELITANLKFWIPGNPAPFATSGEQTWREALVSNLPQYTQVPQMHGLFIDFRLVNLAPLGHPLDVDNLCEPVFSTLINRKGWFGGKRPNLTWWQASKSRSSSPGCQIEVSPNNTASIGRPKGVLVFEDHYSGPLPLSARDPCISSQIQDSIGNQEASSEGRYFIFLRFDNSKLNIGDIAAGKVKTTIDSLYPIVGGVIGQPEDWRVNIIRVEKQAANSTNEGVHISIWRLE